MAGLGSVPKVAKEIESARAVLNNATNGLGARPPWLITEFGANCGQGIGEPGAAQFPSAIHDMIDQASFVPLPVRAFLDDVCMLKQRPVQSLHLPHLQIRTLRPYIVILVSRYTIAAINTLAGDGEPQALSYWAVSDVFEESFFPVHNESFHGAFGLINLHGIPKPT